jgi:hypothetical protein
VTVGDGTATMVDAAVPGTQSPEETMHPEEQMMGTQFKAVSGQDIRNVLHVSGTA